MTSTPPPTPRWGLPLLCLSVVAIGVVLPMLWEWFEWYPAWQVRVAHTGTIATILAAIALLVWFFAFSGCSGRVRLAVAALPLLLALLALALVREVDWLGNLRPFARFRWETRAEDILDRYRDSEIEPSSDIGIIDLSIDPVSDFPRYRGPTGDGIVTPARLLASDWEKETPNILWRRPCGGGYSGIAVAGNVVITIEQRKDEEVLVCYDRATGRTQWTYPYKAHFRDLFGDGPRATPTIYKGSVYSLGGTGELVCVEGGTGHKRWSVNALKKHEASPVSWGVSGSPLIVEEIGAVVVCPGGKTGPALAAYDLDTGDLKWESNGSRGGYSSPLLATLGGRRQVLIFDGNGLAGFDVKDGAELWRHPWETFNCMNLIQPIVLDEDRVFVSSESSNGCALLRVARSDDGFAVRVVWENKEMASKFSNPVAVGGLIFGLSQGVLTCLDQQSGKRHWRGKRYGHGQILAVGGMILVMSEQGAVSLVTADSTKFRELARMEVLREKTWNTPALAGRQLFLRNAREIARVELPLRAQK